MEILVWFMKNEQQWMQIRWTPLLGLSTCIITHSLELRTSYNFVMQIHYSNFEYPKLYFGDHWDNDKENRKECGSGGVELSNGQYRTCHPSYNPLPTPTPTTHPCAKCPPYHRRYIPMHFMYEKFCISAWGFNWQWGRIGSGIGLAPNRWQAIQAITWTNSDPVHRRIYTALRREKLTQVSAIRCRVLDLQMNGSAPNQATCDMPAGHKSALANIACNQHTTRQLKYGMIVPS